MPLTCLLVDDEPPALEVLESHAAQVSQLVIVGKCENALDAFRILQTQSVDLLFLDIQMPTLLGTDFLRSLRRPPKVIFTTAYREYALDGFELNAVDYLLKPIALDRFLRAVDKVMHPDASPLPAPNRSVANQEEFLYLRADRRMVRVQLADLVYVESMKDYVRLYTVADPPLLIKRTISSLETLLPENRFLRIHRSFLVALDKISAFTAAHVFLSHQELPIGRLYCPHVLRTLAGLRLA
ncbi:LytR/AlgR family response regulator transcription factor [Spirosoma flavum]|uniref:LytR/AlgR family response regulator transcription factor n=1 Tax=Spirosoma flavum TaxID=2048557 RepID=A0ABW6AL80_9BACT